MYTPLTPIRLLQLAVVGWWYPQQGAARQGEVFIASSKTDPLYFIHDEIGITIRCQYQAAFGGPDR